MDPRDGDQPGACFREAARAIWAGNQCANCHGLRNNTAVCGNCPQISNPGVLNWIMTNPLDGEIDE